MRPGRRPFEHKAVFQLFGCVELLWGWKNLTGVFSFYGISIGDTFFGVVR